jgi:hypothetical protein
MILKRMAMIDPMVRKNKIISALKSGINNLRKDMEPEIDDELLDYETAIRDICKKLCKSRKYFCERISDTNNIIIRSTDGSVSRTYNIICTDVVTFSGTIGVKEIEKDGGISKHLKYFKLFTDQQAQPLLKNKLNDCLKRINSKNEEDIINLYKEFYDNLKVYFETYPLAMYSLMTGIKDVYNLPSDGIIITPSGHSFVNFDNFKSIDLINRSANFSFETSDNIPCLKIYYQDTKLMHLRTKIDYRNEKFRLRFFMETGKNFFKIFEEFSGDIRNEF